jgi:hypothetical protein
MIITVLFGQLKCNYPGEYGPDALDVIGEFAYSDNPEYFNETLEKYEKSGDYAKLALVDIEISDEKIDATLNPTPKKIKGKIK